MNQATTFRNLVNQEGIIVLPGVYDCLSSILAEKAKHDGVLVTGAGVAASLLGLPDVGLITMTEVLTQTKNIVNSVSIPVIADCDTGYGNAINVYRTVKEFEQVGVAGLFIEDQVFPKRCGHFEKKDVIPKEEMVMKIKAAIDARSNQDMVIIARTDYRANYGIDIAIECANIYSEAGADLIFVEAPNSIQELERIPKEIIKPTMTNMVEGGKTPLMSVNSLRDMGYKIVSYSGTAQKAAIPAMLKAYNELKNKGHLDDILEHIVSINDRSYLLKLQDFYILEDKYKV